MAELPTGTVTFLFTDLESSTRLWELHPEAMQEALARHDALLVQAVETHHGHVVKSTGDGLHAVFATADEGVAAAVAGQQALLTAAWGPIGAVRVRIAQGQLAIGSLGCAGYASAAMPDWYSMREM